MASSRDPRTRLFCFYQFAGGGYNFAVFRHLISAAASSRPRGDMKFLHLPIILASVLVQSVTAADILVLADKNGANLTAQPVSCDGTTLTIIRESDKKRFSIPLERLNDASQARVKAWMAKAADKPRDFEIIVETNKNRRTTGMEDFDDKRVNLEPVVTIRNPENRLAAPAAKVTVVFLGRPVTDTSGFVVFNKTTFDLPELQPLASEVYQIAKISSAYDTRGYAKFGARYCGYVVLIHDEAGEKILDSQSVPPGLDEKFGLKFLNLKTNTIYNRDLR